MAAKKLSGKRQWCRGNQSNAPACSDVFRATNRILRHFLELQMHKTTKQLHICKVRKQSVIGIISVIRRTLSQPAGLTTRGAVSCGSPKRAKLPSLIRLIAPRLTVLTASSQNGCEQLAQSRAFSVSGPAAWNSLPDYPRDPSRSFDSFRRDLKTFLFSF